MDNPRSPFENRSAADWIAQAEKFERIAAHFSANPELGDSFRHLAEDAREKAQHSLR
jgi:hypothetical protein